MTLEHPNENNYGTKLEWGEWREEEKGKPIKGERWMEMLKEHEDYWERKTEKFTEYNVSLPNQKINQPNPNINQPNPNINLPNPNINKPNPNINLPNPNIKLSNPNVQQLNVTNSIKEYPLNVVEKPILVREGLSEFRNNRNYHYGEKWDEYQDGTQHKNVILDDGHGKRTLKELGKKLNEEIMADVQLITDEKGYFVFFIDAKKKKYSSLQELIEEYKDELAWDTCNETIDDISNSIIIFQKEGIDKE